MIGVKSLNYNSWRRAALLVQNDSHLTIEGLKKIVSLKHALNKGLPESLALAFKDVKPLKRFDLKNNSQLDPNWVSGFTEGDGSFIMSKNKVYFDITQSISDIQILYYIKKELVCFFTYFIAIK